MAKEILDKAPEKYRTQCSKCGATFSYQLEDVTAGKFGIGRAVSCPNCSESCTHFAPFKWVP